MRPWKTVDRAATREGVLTLRRRGQDDWVIGIEGRILMTSAAHRSEDALAVIGCRAIADRVRPRVMLGGLGMGYTLRAALDHLPSGAHVVVAELTPEVAAWCRGPLAALTGDAVADKRVRIEIDDVARLLADAPPGRLDAVLLDLYEGPHAASQRADDPHYGPAGLARAQAALAPGGVLAVWSEEPDRPFEERMAAAGFRLERHRAGRGGRHHVVYLGRKAAALPRRRSRTSEASGAA